MANPIEVSVVIPTFNRRDLLPATIDSVLAQTRPVDEIIIVDDGSTDGTDGMLRERYGDRVRYQWQPNAGVSAARNRGMAGARGRYIALLDSDDTWLPDKIRLQLDWLRSHPDFGMVLCDVTRTGADGRVIDVFRRRDTILEDGWILRWIIHDPALAPASAMFRREVFEDVGGFDESLRTAEDLDYHLRVARRWKVGVVEQALVRAMRGHDGLSASGGTYEDYVRVVERALADAGDMIPPAERRQALSATYARNARGMAIRGDWGKALALLGKALRNASAPHSMRNVAAAITFMAKRLASRLLRRIRPPG